MNPKARCRTEGCKGAQLPVTRLDDPEDIAAWNTRAATQAEVTPEEVMRAAKEATAPEWQDVVDGWHMGLDLMKFTSLILALRPVQVPMTDGVREQALDLLATLFDAYENGPACYELPDDCAGYLGNAVQIDHETFHVIASLLNTHRPISTAQAKKEGV